MCISLNEQTFQQQAGISLREQFLFTGQEPPQCAWCLAEQGLDFGNGSHGICPQHATLLLQQSRERSARRYLLRQQASA
jgi:hypothetical protein